MSNCSEVKLYPTSADSTLPVGKKRKMEDDQATPAKAKKIKTEVKTEPEESSSDENTEKKKKKKKKRDSGELDTSTAGESRIRTPMSDLSVKAELI